MQAEAIAPDVRDRIVIDAIDALHDVPQREAVIAAEADLHADARRALAARLNGSGD